MKRNRILALSLVAAVVSLIVVIGPILAWLHSTGLHSRLPARRADRTRADAATRHLARHYARPQLAAPEAATSTPPDTSPSLADAGAQPASQPGSLKRLRRDRDTVRNELVLSFANAAARSRFLALAASKGAEALDLMDLGNSVRLRIEKPESLQSILDAGSRPDDYSFNHYVFLPEVPEKRDVAPPRPLTAFGGTALDKLGVKDNAAWGQGVTIAVLDTTCEPLPGIAENKIESRSLIADPSAEAGKYSGHATAIVSLILGSPPNVQGMAPASSVLNLKVMTEDGVGDCFTLAKGIVEAVDHGARVINLCMGTQGDSFILREAVNYALKNGVAVVAAVGNDGVEGVTSPARYPGVLAVTAIDAEGRQAYFANRGDEVGIAAPGVGINSITTNNAVEWFSGTSAAVPFVSGALAALLASDPALSATSAVSILCQYSDDTGEPGRDKVFGQGILDMERVTERDTRGIYDVTVCRPYARWSNAQHDELCVTAFAQNTGTERIGALVLKVDIGGNPYTARFDNVGVSESVSREFRLSRSDIAKFGTIPIACSATMEGVRDRRPADNTSSLVIVVDTALK